MTADGVVPLPEGPCLLREEELLACWRADEQVFVEVPRRRYVIPHTELAIEDGVVVRASDGQAVPAHGALAPALVSAHGTDLVYVSSDGAWHHRTDHDDHVIEVAGDLADDPLIDLFAECALTRSGAVYCLREDSPNLHEATQVARVPGAVRLVSTRWSEPPLGRDDARGPAQLPVTPSLRARCVLRDDGEVSCSVQRGEAQAPPFRALSALGPGSFQAIDAAGRHLCALTGNGEVRCLDLGGSARATVPARGAVAIAVGDQLACALTRGHGAPAVGCWPLRSPAHGGRAARPGVHEHIVRVTGGGVGARVVSARANAGCVLFHGVRCWDAREPAQLAPAGGGVVAIRGLERAVSLSVSGALACAVRDDGQVWCWGRGEHDEPERGPLDAPATSPRRISLPPAISVSVKRDALCAVLVDRTVACTGRIDLSEDGLRLRGTARRAPLLLEGFEQVRRVDLGDDGALCVVHEESDPHVSCIGAVLDSEGSRRLRGVPIAGTSDVRSLHLSGQHVCALRRDGSLVCWPGRGGARVAFEPREVPSSNWVSEGCVLTTASEVLCGAGAHAFTEMRRIGEGFGDLDPRSTSTAGCATGARGTWCWSSEGVSPTPDDVLWDAGGTVSYAGETDE
jgi:hypothetical protein